MSNSETMQQTVGDLSNRAREQQLRLDESIRVAEHMAQRAGHELPIVPVESPEDIASDPGVYILTDQPDIPIQGAHFRVKPELLSGARDSGHAVVSGTVSLDRIGPGYTGPSAFDVAVKCFTGKRTPEERIERGRREMDLSAQMYNLGRIAFKPRGMVIGRVDGPTEGAVAVMTDYDASIMSLDNWTWADGAQSTLAMATQGAEAIGETNALGFEHGDAKVKNVAQHEDGGMGMIDFETSRSIDPDSPFQAAGAMLTDLSLYVDSLDDRGFFNRRQGHERNALQDITAAYMAGWGNKISDAVTDSLFVTAPSIIRNSGIGQRLGLSY